MSKFNCYLYLNFYRKILPVNIFSESSVAVMTLYVPYAVISALITTNHCAIRNAESVDQVRSVQQICVELQPSDFHRLKSVRCEKEGGVFPPKITHTEYSLIIEIDYETFPFLMQSKTFLLIHRNRAGVCVVINHDRGRSDSTWCKLQMLALYSLIC